MILSSGNSDQHMHTLHGHVVGTAPYLHCAVGGLPVLDRFIQGKFLYLDNIWLILLKEKIKMAV